MWFKVGSMVLGWVANYKKWFGAVLGLVGVVGVLALGLWAWRVEVLEPQKELQKQVDNYKKRLNSCLESQKRVFETQQRDSADVINSYIERRFDEIIDDNSTFDDSWLF